MSLFDTLSDILFDIYIYIILNMMCYFKMYYILLDILTYDNTLYISFPTRCWGLFEPSKVSPSLIFHVIFCFQTRIPPLLHSGGKERTTSIRLGAPRISETSSSSGKTGQADSVFVLCVVNLRPPTYPTQKERFEALFFGGR